MSSNKKILFWTGRGRGFGNGHWVRVNRLAELLRSVHPEWEIKISTDEAGSFLEGCQMYGPDLVLVDLRESHSGMIPAARSLGAKTVVFDSRSPERNEADYVVEAYPSLEDRPGRANLTGVSWLPSLEEKTRETTSLPWKRQNVFRILLYLGGVEEESVRGLMREGLEAWLKSGAANEIKSSGKAAVEILEISQDPPRVESPSEVERGIFSKRIGFREDFSELQASCDLFVGYFGTSVFEALALGRNVLILNPSSYHGALSSKHLERLVVSGPDNKFPTFSEVKSGSAGYAAQFQLGRNFHLFPKILEALLNEDPRGSICRACGSKSGQVVSRRKQANLLECGSCGLIWMKEFLPLAEFEDPNDPAHGSNIYGSEYFVEEYIKTYGKTYEEDRANIHRYSDERLSRIRPLAQKGRLLD
ncbi:MAG: hypothetical protein JNM63_13115, partial [Spirochaetia bacterium]|nr:hypothetical protein [Spirochaetia bacterium]